MSLVYDYILHYKDVGNSTSSSSISILASQFLFAHLFASKQNNLSGISWIKLISIMMVF